MTPHIEAHISDIAETVLMPGDPLRAKFIAETFLDDAKLVNQVRNMLAYTGTVNGKKVTVMGSGMGLPSMGIYSWELFTHYDVQRIIRIGSCGAYSTELNLFDLVLAESAYSESTFARVQNGIETQLNYPSETLNKTLRHKAAELNFPLKSGPVHSSDVFYRADANHYKAIYREFGTLAVEMEAFALFHNAHVCGKEAACLLTVSDIIPTGAAASAKERQLAFTQMMQVAIAAISD